MLSFFQEGGGTYAWAEIGNSTTVHPAGLAALGLLLALTLVLPRNWSLLPILVLTCVIPFGQRIVVASLDFTFLRLLVMAAWFRLMVRGEIRSIRWSYLDMTVIAWATLAAVLETLRADDPGKAIINRLGYALDALGVYFYFRMQLRSFGDLERSIRTLIFASFPLLVFFLLESQTRFNMFHVFGGVPQTTMIRNGRLRCQGPYTHPILAGCFWACLVPLFLVRAQLVRDKLLGLAGAAAAIGIVGASASSTPVMALVFGAAAAGFWLVRGAVRWFRWILIIIMASLHYVLMEKPIWHLMARVDFVGGSTGYHRYHLMDQCVNRFDEWWLMGTHGTGHWGWGLQDITNHYVLEAVGGGVWRLAAFVLLLALAFITAGRAARNSHLSKREQIVAWTLGASMFIHTMNFLAVSYFHQIMVLFNLHLAILASLFRPPGAVTSTDRHRLGAKLRDVDPQDGSPRQPERPGPELLGTQP